MLMHHFAMGIYDGGNEILYFDSLGWPLSDGTVNGTPTPATPNIRRDLIHAVRGILGDEAPEELTVREHRLDEGEHNPQDDLHFPCFADRQHKCGLHALLILEAYLFQSHDCFIQHLHIINERDRVIKMLRDLGQRRHFTYIEPNSGDELPMWIPLRRPTTLRHLNRQRLRLSPRSPPTTLLAFRHQNPQLTP